MRSTSRSGLRLSIAFDLGSQEASARTGLYTHTDDEARLDVLTRLHDLLGEDQDEAEDNEAES